MEALVCELLGAHVCQFIPRHTRNLANEFRCYANYPSGLDTVSDISEQPHPPTDTS